MKLPLMGLGILTGGLKFVLGAKPPLVTPMPKPSP